MNCYGVRQGLLKVSAGLGVLHQLLVFITTCKLNNYSIYYSFPFDFFFFCLNHIQSSLTTDILNMEESYGINSSTNSRYNRPPTDTSINLVRRFIFKKRTTIKSVEYHVYQ